jgi:prepilin-type N-terminal cleavage/methylation domain-containing protein
MKPSKKTTCALQDGFTITELLVVVAVIAILVTIAFITLYSARDKARIARARQFEKAVDRALRIDIKTEILFEQLEPDGDPLDTSGYKHTATLSPGATISETDCLFGKCVHLDGSGDLVEVDSNYNAEDFKNNALTFMAWVFINDISTVHDYWLAAGSDASPFFQGGITAATDVIRSRIRLSAGVNVKDGALLSRQRWHHVAVMFDGSKRYHFIDGERVATFVNSGTLASPVGEDLHIGSDGLSTAWDGMIDSVRVYNSSLTF